MKTLLRGEKNQFKFSFSVTQIEFFLILFPFFELTYFSRFSLLDNFYTIAKLLSLGYTLLYLLKSRKKTYSHFLIWAVGYNLYLLVNTFVQKGSFSTAISSSLYMIGLLLVVSTLIERNSYDLISTMMFIFELIIYANLFAMLTNPDGLYGEADSSRHYWLLGHQNQTILYVICAILFAVLYMQMKKQIFGQTYSIRSVALIIASISTIFYIWSATSIVGLFIILAVVLLNRFNIRLTIWQGIFLSIIIFLGIIVFRYQSAFNDFIQNFLQRDLTFTGRTYIWDKALAYVKEKPIFGYGVESYTVASMRFGFNTTHCKYLYSLYQGGIVLFFLQLGIFASVARIDKRNKKKIPIILVACCFALFIQMTFESYTNAIFYLPFLLITKYEWLDFTLMKNRNNYHVNRVLIKV